MITSKELEIIRGFAIKHFNELGDSKTLADLNRPLDLQEKIALSYFLGVVNVLNKKGLTKIDDQVLKDL